MLSHRIIGKVWRSDVKEKRLFQKVEAFFYNRILYCFDYHVSETFKVSET